MSEPIFNTQWAVFKILQNFVMHLIKYCLHTNELKGLFIRLDNFWHQIWNQWLKLSGKNTPYFYLRLWFKNKQVWTSLSKNKSEMNGIFLGPKSCEQLPLVIGMYQCAIKFWWKMLISGHLWLLCSKDVFKLAVRTRLHAGRAELLRTEIHPVLLLSCI